MENFIGQQWRGKKWYCYGTSMTDNSVRPGRNAGQLFDGQKSSPDRTGFYSQYLAEYAGLEEHNFGKGGKGNLALLKEMSAEYDYHVHIIEKLKYNGKEISSTYIRELIAAGDMQAANDMLGNTFGITGMVVRGAHKGTGFGVPTVNLVAEQGKLLPPDGVYVSTVKCGDKIYEGITNIGIKPTVSDLNIRGIETHLYECNEDLYDSYITVNLFCHLRKEMKFANVEELIKQMEEDKETGRLLHEKRRMGQ